MPTQSVQALAIQGLLERREDSATRFVDMGLALGIVDEKDGPVRQWLLSAGGRWDRSERQYVGPAKQGHVITFQPAQHEAAYWLADWWRRFVTDDWDGYERAWSCFWVAKRRRGKSHALCAALHAQCVLVPASICWAVSPTQENTEELRRELEGMIPIQWARWKADDECFVYANGSQLFMRSAFKPHKLKMGRADVVGLNEAQLMDKRSFVQVRGAIADRGGLVIVAANPPDSRKGLWVQDLYEKIIKKQVAAVYHNFNARENPYIEEQALLDLAREVDEATYRRDVLGEFVPLGDRAIASWSESQVLEVPAHFVDVTRAWCRYWLNIDIDTIIGADFDKRPYCAGAVIRLYCDPDAPQIVYPWVIAEAMADQGEAHMAEKLLALPTLALPGAPARDQLIHTKSALVIGDASGSWQSTKERRKNLERPSFRILGEHGFRVVKNQWPRSERNPEEKDRFALHNLLCRSSAGISRLRIRPACEELIRCHREYESVNGKPKFVSNWAHGVDAVGYALWRLFGLDQPRTLDWSPLIQAQEPRKPPPPKPQATSRTRRGLAKKIRSL